MFKFGNTLLDLNSVVAIQWGGDTCSIVVTIANTQLYLTPEFKESDDINLTYNEVCELRYNELVGAWIDAKKI